MPQRQIAGSPRRRLERVFVLRVWREAGSPPGAMRGSVVELGSERRFFFTQLGDLRDFLSRTLAMPDPDGTIPGATGRPLPADRVSPHTATGNRRLS
jgi:hypothetical protein